MQRVDGLFLTHFHTDHVAGVPGVPAEVEVATAYLSPVRDPPDVAAAAELPGVLQERTGIEPDLSELDPVVGVHTGPGTLGVAVAPQPS